jgi:hypothetical protein
MLRERRAGRVAVPSSCMKRSCLEARGLERQGEGEECGQFLQCIESVGCDVIVSKHHHLNTKENVRFGMERLPRNLIKGCLASIARVAFMVGLKWASLGSLE